MFGWMVSRSCIVSKRLRIRPSYTVSQKNAPSLASSSFDKHGLILIIFGEQHQHTVNEALLQVAGHSGWCHGQVFVQYTHVSALVHKFCSQPDCLVNTDLER